MNSNWISLLIRLIVIVALQIIVFKRISFDGAVLSYLHIIIYPLWLMTAPIKFPKPVLLILAFIVGLFIDMFYNSPGVHAATFVFTAFMRDYILKFLEPDIGYDPDRPFSLSKVGIIWFLSYTALYMAIHLLTYFSIEAFSFVYIYEIIISTIISLIFSVLIIMVFVLIQNPKK